jgi:putative tricarboxylic transport membrane protein
MIVGMTLAARSFSRTMTIVLLFFSLVLAACTPERSVDALESTASGYPQRALSLLAPANPGGGWDQTARQIRQVLTETGIVGVPVEVVNRGGAGGTIGLADLVTRHRNNPHTIMVFGQVMLGAIRTNNSAVSLDETVPLARLLSEYEVVAVPTDSPYHRLQDLVEDLKAAPETISWAGGSAGGVDHILAGLITQAAGADPRRVNYIAHSGGGEAAVAVMGGHVVAGISGLGEWGAHLESGRMRALAVSSPERVGDGSIPTIRESGLDVALSNWRALAAPPGTDEDTQDWLVRALERMRESPAWQEILRVNEWEDSFLTGAAFVQFLADEAATTDAALRAIGLVQ